MIFMKPNFQYNYMQNNYNQIEYKQCIYISAKTADSNTQNMKYHNDTFLMNKIF